MPAIFWTALAAGILIKGPVNLMIVGLAAVTLSIYDRSARWLLALRPLAGLAWLVLIVLPWFIAIYMRVGYAFLVNSVGHDMLGKLASAQEAHGAPPGLYLVLFFATFFPGSILAGLAAPAVWTVRREPAARFLLAWLVPSWIVFELVVTKLPHYVLPLYPAIAILIAGAVESNVLSRRPWLVRGAVWWFLAPILISIGAVTFAIIVARDPAFPAWPFFAVAIVCGLFAWQLYEDDGAERSFLRATAGMVMLAIGVFAVIVPSLRPVFPTVTLAHVLRNAGCEHPVAASAGYEEPSLVFLAGTKTRFTDAAAPPISSMAGLAASPSSRAARSAPLRCAPRRSGCDTPAGRASTATTSASAGRSPSRFSLPQARRECGKVLSSSAPRQNVLRNFRQWICVLMRAPRASAPPPSAGAIAATIVMLIASSACMFLIDTAASAWARTLPQWFEDVFERITDFGLSGWFLFPFGFILLCLAAVTSPRLTRLTQGVLAMLAVRFGFLFLAIGVPGLFVTIVKRLIGRARPYVGSHDDPFAYRPFIWPPEYASMPSGHATTAASAAIAIGALWPAAAP